MRIIQIEDPVDPRIGAYRDIRERDLVGRERLFVAEGRVVLEKMLAAPGFRPLSLLIAEKRLDALAPLLALVPDDVPIFAATGDVLDAIAGFPLHRGILAIGRRIDLPTPDALLAGLPERAIVLLLSGIANHDNMGGIFRNAAAFGADAILLDPDCCDPLYRKAIRVSVGATFLVPYAHLPRDLDANVLLNSHRFNCIALDLRGEIELAWCKRSPRMAVLLGAEGPGLPPALLAGATGVRIPMAPGFDSLNVATTSGIVLHHLVDRGSDRA